MSLSSLDSPDAAVNREMLGPDPAVFPHTSLESLVHLLQGSPKPTLADVGITSLPAVQLDRIFHNAREEAELCQCRSELLLELLECCLESGALPETGTLVRMTRQLLRLARDQRRWFELGDNAAYYRDNTQVASRIAQYLHASQDTRPAPDQPRGDQ